MAGDFGGFTSRVTDATRRALLDLLRRIKGVEDRTAALEAAAPVPHIHLTRSAALSVANAGGGTQVTWGTSESFVSHEESAGSFKDATADIVTIPVDGLYLVAHGAEFAVNTTGLRQSQVQVASNTANPNELAAYQLSHEATGTLADRVRGSFVARLAAGSTLTHTLYQNSGGALNATDMNLSVVKLAD